MSRPLVDTCTRRRRRRRRRRLLATTRVRTYVRASYELTFNVSHSTENGSFSRRSSY